MKKQANNKEGRNSCASGLPMRVFSLAVCLLDGQELGIPMEFIQEVLHSPFRFDPPPFFIPTLAGTTDLRGLQLPTFHLNLLLGMPQKQETTGQRILVCRMVGFRAGLLVDTIREILSVPENYIQPARQRTAIITQMAQLDRERRSLPILEMASLTEHLQELLHAA